MINIGIIGTGIRGIVCFGKEMLANSRVKLLALADGEAGYWSIGIGEAAEESFEKGVTVNL